MKVSFKQQVKLGNRVYPKGTHDVPEADLKGWFFEALLKDGNAGIEEEILQSPVSEEVSIAEPIFEEPVDAAPSESVKDSKKKRRK